jgi:hypothetical protein
MESGRFLAQIPHRRIFYAPELYQRWPNMWTAYLASDRTDATVWQEFETLLKVPGFRFAHWTGGRFAEAMVAFELQREGYECFRACSLFRRGRGKLPEVYELAESRLAAAGLPMPREFGTRIEPRPRNPDLAACHPRHGWRFCEVKWKQSEKPSDGQLVALAVLRELLHAQVEVVRVVPEEHRASPEPSPYGCGYTIR